VKYELVPFTRGRVIEVGNTRPFPHFIGVSPEDISLFADETMDAVYSENLDKFKDPKKALTQWWRVLKKGGYLIVKDAKDMESVGTWDCVYTADTWAVYQKGGPGHRYSGKKPKPEKSCLVIRYGAIGDMIQTSSIFPALKKQGYHITVNCYESGKEILMNDPNVDAFLVQDRDQVPNVDLGEYWEYLATQYTKVVNLSESVEGSLLAVEGRTPWYWPKEVRHKYMNHNYLETTHLIAEVEGPYLAKFHPTQEEREWAAKERMKMGSGPIVMWSLSGSSVHKSWPHLDTIIARFLTSFDGKIVLVGDEMCQLLEEPWKNEPRVIRRSGVWKIRESLTFACKQADIVIGPETGLLNAVGMEEVAKVCMLSHSTKENLTKHWKNTVAIEPPKSVPCYPCHKLHTSFRDCPRGETGTSLCQEMIPADVVWPAMLGILKRTNRIAV
jgi:ADP-heptose:LPS heptosyltransferase